MADKAGGGNRSGAEPPASPTPSEMGEPAAASRGLGLTPRSPRLKARHVRVTLRHGISEPSPGSTQGTPGRGRQGDKDRVQRGRGPCAPNPQRRNGGASIRPPPPTGRAVPSPAEAGTPYSKISRWRHTCRSLTRGTSPRGKRSGNPVASGIPRGARGRPLTSNSRRLSTQRRQGRHQGADPGPADQSSKWAGAPISQAALSPPSRGEAWRVSIHLPLRSEGGSRYRRHGPWPWPLLAEVHHAIAPKLGRRTQYPCAGCAYFLPRAATQGVVCPVWVGSWGAKPGVETAEARVREPDGPRGSRGQVLSPEGPWGRTGTGDWQRGPEDWGDSDERSGGWVSAREPGAVRLG